MDPELRQLTEKVADFIAAGGGAGKSESEFETLALEIFQFQYRTIEPYRKLCQRLGRTPTTVHTWSGIPAVPADAFKHFFLFAGRLEDVVKSFKSSGTSDSYRCSQAHFSSQGLKLMDLAIEANAARRLFLDGRRTRIMVLAPGPDHAPTMIMAYGMAQLVRRFGRAGSRFLIGPEGLSLEAVVSELRQCQDQGIPVTLMGSSFGFVHLFDAMTKRGLKWSLPPGSRLMDAGGYKGRSREIERETFVAWAGSILGLPPERVVNLLGMTELASQIYDGIRDRTLRRRSSPVIRSDDGLPIRMKEPPHWARTMLVDPRRLHHGECQFITAPEQIGLLRHLDLANVERPLMIQTEDLGVWRIAPPENGSGQDKQPGFEILGRAKGAEPRGCSLRLEEFHQGRTRAAHTFSERIEL